MHAATRQDVEQRDALGDLDRVIHRRRQAHDAVAEADVRRAAGQVRKEGFRRAHVRIVGQRRVPHAPDRVEADLLGERVPVQAGPHEYRAVLEDKNDALLVISQKRAA